MKRVTVIISLLVIGGGALTAQTLQQEPPQPAFGTVEVWADSGDEPIAAWQVELTAQQRGVRIVGVEGGAHPAYTQPPYYDTRAMQNDRVILAALSTADADGLPTGATRVATVHYLSETGQPPRFDSKFVTAANAKDHRIALTVTLKNHHAEGTEP